jgi:hypothetical protein
MSDNKYTAESGHWYTREGDPAYTVIGANGKERNTTLRDARKDNLVPSVTTILKVAAAPGLEAWKQNQVLLAALTLPRNEGESESDWIDRVMQDSRETGRKAAERGTEIHAAIQQAFDGEVYGDEYARFIEGADMAITEHFGQHDWVCELSFAHSLGFGGKVDMHTKGSDGTGIVVDIKTKDFGPDDDIKGFDEQLMQLAAYRMGLGLPKARCANVFVSRTHPGLAHVIEWSEEELEKGRKMFNRLLSYWQIKNNYQ